MPCCPLLFYFLETLFYRSCFYELERTALSFETIDVFIFNLLLGNVLKTLINSNCLINLPRKAFVQTKKNTVFTILIQLPMCKQLFWGDLSNNRQVDFLLCAHVGTECDKWLMFKMSLTAIPWRNFKSSFITSPFWGIKEPGNNPSLL